MRNPRILIRDDVLLATYAELENFQFLKSSFTISIETSIQR
jgi:hypothetical protein